MRIEDTCVLEKLFAHSSLYLLLSVQAATMEQDLTVPDGIP